MNKQEAIARAITALDYRITCVVLDLEKRGEEENGVTKLLRQGLENDRIALKILIGPEGVSSCCNASLKVAGGNDRNKNGEGTNWYECEKCGNACDAKSVESEI